MDMPLTEYILLFSTTLTGGILALWLHRGNTHNYIELLLSFSGAFLFAITVLHLIPTVYAFNNYHVGIFILVGFFLQLLLEQLSKGAEHGHVHTPFGASKWYVTSVVFGLSLHAFMEGIPLAGEQVLHEHKSTEWHQPLLYGIALHKIPEGFALITMLLWTAIGRTTVVMLLIMVGLMSPLGIFFGQSFSGVETERLGLLFSIMLAIVIGSFLHISTTIVFESSAKGHKFSLPKLAAIMAGGAIAFLWI